METRAWPNNLYLGHKFNKYSYISDLNKLDKIKQTEIWDEFSILTWGNGFGIFHVRDSNFT